MNKFSVYFFAGFFLTLSRHSEADLGTLLHYFIIAALLKVWTVTRYCCRVIKLASIPLFLAVNCSGKVHHFRWVNVPEFSSGIYLLVSFTVWQTLFNIRWNVLLSVLFLIANFSPRMLRGAGEAIWTSACGFLKTAFSKALIFCDFSYYHKSHFFWKVDWISSGHSENMKIFIVNINYFHDFFGFSHICLLETNQWRQNIKDNVSIFITSTYFK